MTAPRKLVLAVIAAALALTTLAVAPAEAAFRLRVDDARGDAPARADIWGANLFIENDPDAHPRFQVSTRIADLGDSGNYSFDFARPGEAGFRVTVTKEPGKAPVGTLAKLPVHDPPWVRVPCSLGMVWDREHDVVSAWVPGACVGEDLFEGMRFHHVQFTSGGARDVAWIPSRMKSSYVTSYYWQDFTADAAGDAPIAVDIRRVRHYRHTGLTMTEVADLGDAGNYRQYYPIPDSEDSLLLVVVKSAGSAPRYAVKAFNDGGPMTGTDCKVDVGWDTQRNRITVSEMYGGTHWACDTDGPYGPVRVRPGGVHLERWNQGRVSQDYAAIRDEDVDRRISTFHTVRGNTIPAVDVQSVSVTSTPGAIWTTLRVADLGPEGIMTAVYGTDYGNQDPPPGIVVTVSKGRDKQPVAQLSLAPSQSDAGQPIACRMRVVWSQAGNYVTVQVPRRCHRVLQNPPGYTAFQAAGFRLGRLPIWAGDVGDSLYFEGELDNTRGTNP